MVNGNETCEKYDLSRPKRDDKVRPCKLCANPLINLLRIRVYVSLPLHATLKRFVYKKRKIH